MGAELPTEIRYPDRLDVEKVVKTLPPGFGSPASTTGVENGNSSTNNTDGHVHRIALVFALFGWEADEGHVAGVATCNACFRRLGLWLFKPAASSAAAGNNNNNNNNDNHDSMDLDEGPLMSCLDVSKEHRAYCPWVNPATQNGGRRRPTIAATGTTTTEDKAGWEELVRALQSAHHFRQRASATAMSDYGLLGPIVGADARAETDGATAAAAAPATSDQQQPSAADAAALRDQKDKAQLAKLMKLRKMFDFTKRGRTHK
jgi:hypothetical protein